MKQLRALVPLAACLALAACDNQYFERKDTLTLGVGDAVASNNAVQVQDPWPRRSQNDRIPMDGGKAEAAMARYRGAGSAGSANGNSGSNGASSAAAR